jgi:hypothetical protein
MEHNTCLSFLRPCLCPLFLSSFHCLCLYHRFTILCVPPFSVYLIVSINLTLFLRHFFVLLLSFSLKIKRKFSSLYFSNSIFEFHSLLLLSWFPSINLCLRICLITFCLSVHFCFLYLHFPNKFSVLTFLLLPL